MNHSVRQADVAARAGVSTFTVSQTLAGKKGVKPATQERVLQAARELGYEVNRVASLLAQRRVHTNRETRIAIAYLSAQKENTSFLESCRLRGVEGAIILPKELPAGRRASRILHHRGIEGLLVSVHADFWPPAAFAEFEWQRFSLVKINRGLETLPCHLVRHSPFDYTMKALESVLEHGYRRLGVLMMTRTAARVDDDARVGALHAFRERRMPAGGHLVPLYVSQSSMPSATDIRRWVRREKLDALLAYHSWMVRHLLLVGMQFPEEIPVAAIVRAHLGMDGVSIAGCDVKGDERIERALTILLELIGRGEKGLPISPMQSVLEPSWIDGDSLPRVSPG